MNECVCRNCNGTGFLQVNFRHHVPFETRKNKTILIECRQCEGKGWVDWLQNIFDNKSAQEFEDELISLYHLEMCAIISVSKAYCMENRELFVDYDEPKYKWSKQR